MEGSGDGLIYLRFYPGIFLEGMRNKSWPPENKTEVLCSSLSSSVYVSDKLDITYSRSSGPGGQNVDKVNTKVDLRFHVASAEWLSQDIRDRILEQVWLVY